jgi:protein-tyrosine-phosphatase
MVMEFVNGRSCEEVPDPYYGTVEEFERVMNDLVIASEQILVRMASEYPSVALQLSGA